MPVICHWGFHWYCMMYHENAFRITRPLWGKPVGDNADFRCLVRCQSQWAIGQAAIWDIMTLMDVTVRRGSHTIPPPPPYDYCLWDLTRWHYTILHLLVKDAGLAADHYFNFMYILSPCCPKRASTITDTSISVPSIYGMYIVLLALLSGDRRGI